MNARVVFTFVFWLSLCGFTNAAETLKFLWTVRPVPASWVVKGRIVDYDPGRENGQFFSNAVYYDDKGNVWPLLGSVWNVVQMIRCELPDGIDADFARNRLLFTLTVFNDTEGLIADDGSIESVIHGLADLETDKEAQKLVRELFDKPVITVSGNQWSARFMTITLRERVRLNSIKGTLKPFSVETEIVEAITDAASDNLRGEHLKAALVRKKAVLSRWGDTSK
jgi:hypothetical protein